MMPAPPRRFLLPATGLAILLTTCAACSSEPAAVTMASTILNDQSLGAYGTLVVR
jgi:hypothetical protein